MIQLGSGFTDAKWTAFQVGNTLYLFNPTDGFRKYNGTSLSTITVAAEAPATPTYNTSPAGSLTAAKTYRWKLTFINPSLGIESEGSPEFSRTLGGAETGVTLTLPAPTSPYTRTRVYRTVADGNAFFLEGDTADTSFSSTAGDVTLGITLDTTIDVMTSIPTGNFAFTYKGYIFIVQDNAVRFTRLVASDSDGYYLDTDRFDLDTRFGKTTGGGVVGDTALIFTASSIFGVSGTDPSVFTFRTLNQGIGLASQYTLTATPDGSLLGFAGTKGIILIKENDLKRLTESGQTLDVEQISTPDLDPVFQGIDSEIKLNPSEYKDATAYFDTENNNYHLYTSGYHFYYNTINKQWGHEKDVDAKRALFVRTGNQSSSGYTIDSRGFLNAEDISYTKLVPNGTVTGNPTSGTRVTVTDSGATFDTLGDGLKGAYLIIDHDTIVESRQITSNTATVITVDAPFDIIPAASDTYYIGYIQCRLMTKQYQLSKDITDVVKNSHFAIVNEKSVESQNLLLKWVVDKKEFFQDSTVIDLTNNIYDKRSAPMRGRFVQVYMYSHFNKQKSRDKNPVILLSYAFFATDKGER